MIRLRAIAARAADTARWLWRYWRTTPADRYGLCSKIIKAPRCWVVGHDWASRHGSIEITNWTLQYCQCCSEEICGRTGFHQIINRPDDLDYVEEFSRYDDDDDAAPADWDEMRDIAAANGGPF